MVTKDELLAKLRSAGVVFEEHTHPAVMTVEAQVQELAAVPGVPVKNLFLKDKKNRLYVITALPSTTVDLKVLSSRLGMGKGSIRMAEAELIQEVLKVPLGSVTPLAMANPEASCVALLLDQKIQVQDRVFVHPLVNTSSLSMVPSALDAALRAVGREPVYVDLEADPKIDRDNPPDLAKYVPAEAAAAAAAPNGASATPAAAASTSGSSGQQQQQQKAPATQQQGGQQQGAAAAAAGSSKAPAAGASKGGKKQPAASAQQTSTAVHMRVTDVHAQTQELLDKVAQALLGTKLADAKVSDSYVLTRLRADVESQLNAFKNAAYTLGYTSGKGEVVAFAEKRYT